LSLLDKLRSQLGNAGREQIQDETARAEDLQRGLTGRDLGPSSSPVSSRLSERIARQQVQAASDEQTQKEVIQSEQLGLAEQAQEQAFSDDQLGQIEQAMNAKQSAAQQTEAILNSLEREGKQLNLQKDAAKLEQIGFNLRMNNKKYIDSLTQSGQTARLEDSTRFEEELKRAIFADQIDLLNNDLSFRRMIDADERELARDLSSISLEQAMQIAATQNQQINQAAKYNSISQVVKGGAQAYAAMEDE
jgi:hypothetical protein